MTERSKEGQAISHLSKHFVKCLIAVLPMMSAPAAIAVPLSFLDYNGDPLADVLVYAELPAGHPAVALPALPVTISQKNRAFAPYVTAAHHTQRTHFTNQDDITHHIYSVNGNNRFSFKLGAGKQRSEQFKLPEGQDHEVIAMGCNIHDWMSGHLLLLDTPLFAATNTQGTTELDLIPGYSYKLNIWHPQLLLKDNLHTVELELDADQTKRTIKVPGVLADLPPQRGEDDFEFLDDY